MVVAVLCSKPIRTLLKIVPVSELLLRPPAPPAPPHPSLPLSPSSETFSFVLTEIDGSRRNGYCRRLLVSWARGVSVGLRCVVLCCVRDAVVSASLFSLHVLVPCSLVGRELDPPRPTASSARWPASDSSPK